MIMDRKDKQGTSRQFTLVRFRLEYGILRHIKEPFTHIQPVSKKIMYPDKTNSLPVSAPIRICPTTGVMSRNRS